MSDRRKQFPFPEFEPKWQQYWLEDRTFHVPNPGEPSFDAEKPKFFVMDMFPYPSGEGLHVGHPEGYTATDILARHKRMRGFNVLHPIGWDAFGLPAEQFAINTGQHPSVATVQNVSRFKKQLQQIGFSYDWEREINTTDPEYYRWTQWIFLQLYKAWFNPEAKAARPIAELEAKCKASHPNESADELRAFLDEHRLAYVSEAPVNWCPELGTVLANEEVIDGKSERGGFPVGPRPMRQWVLRLPACADRFIHELDGLDWPDSIKGLERNWIGRSEGAEVHFSIPRRNEKVTVFTTRPDTLFGATYVVLSPEHPLVDIFTSPEQKPAVQAYQKEVATKSDLERTDLAKEKTGVFTGGFVRNPVNNEKIPVWVADYVLASYGTGAIMAVPAHDDRDFEFAQKFGLEIRKVLEPLTPVEGCFTGEGTSVNSDFLNDLATRDAKRKIIDWLEEKGAGKRSINFKLRDWLFSRQRYWGEPFPIIWRNGHHEALNESSLPVVPPPLADYRPTGTTDPPLAKAEEWKRLPDGAIRELNTMPQWAGSCWYYLRYIAPLTTDEISSEYGADSLRLYEMFMGPLEATKPWSMSGVEGVYRFLARFWRLAMEENQEGRWQPSSSLREVEPSRQQLRVVHATIKKVTQDIEALAFNTAISQMMICVNAFTNVEPRPVTAIRTFSILLTPFAPHLAEEIWHQLRSRFPGFVGLVSKQPWPSCNEEYLAEDEVEVIIQVNGKLRDKMTVAKDLDEASLEQLAQT